MTTFETKLLTWYHSHGRDLPWRKTNDPYKILVSEVMLQQTQVDRVIKKYQEFLQLFPSVQQLASASPREVIKAWSGLGYNRRAIKLQECAQAVVKQYDGKFPTSEQELVHLPGIGPYTSAAILAFAYNQPALVIDTNIRRIFFRIFLGEESLLPQLQKTIQSFISKKNSREYHNALMDLGATICTARNPKCESCIFSSECISVKKYSTAEMEEMASRIFKTKQSTFLGSNRYYRSMILKAVQEKNKISLEEVQKMLPKEKDSHTIILKLIKDKLILLKEGEIILP